MTRKLEDDVMRRARVCSTPGCEWWVDVRDISHPSAERQFHEHMCGPRQVIALGDDWAVARCAGRPSMTVIGPCAEINAREWLDEADDVGHEGL
jgi:hypothetical protein